MATPAPQILLPFLRFFSVPCPCSSLPGPCPLASSLTCATWVGKGAVGAPDSALRAHPAERPGAWRLARCGRVHDARVTAPSPTAARRATERRAGSGLGQEARGPPGPSGTPRPPWVAPALSAALIVTTAVAIVGNLLVILSVLGNRKLRNAGERHARCCVGPPSGVWSWPLTLILQSAALSLVRPPCRVPFSLTSPRVWS